MLKFTRQDFIKTVKLHFKLDSNKFATTSQIISIINPRIIKYHHTHCTY